MPRKYLLGHAPKEQQRLTAQSRLWDPISKRLFAQAGIAPGQRVLELGPGQGSLHAALRRRVRGPIDAVEQSEVYAAATQARVRRDGFGEGHWYMGHINDVQLPARTYDVIFARWVFLFLTKPEHVVRRLVHALRPGGKLVLQDYHRSTLAMIPPAPHWRELVAADAAFFANQGGNVSVGDDLPTIMKGAGLQLEPIVPHTLVGHPGSMVWDWISTYFLGIMPRYAGLAGLSPAKAKTLMRAWQRAARDPSTVVIAPTVLDLIGVRGRAR